jgi:hypothetical protein
MRKTTFLTSAFRTVSVLIKIRINNLGRKVEEQPTITDRHLSKRYTYEPVEPYKLPTKQIMTHYNIILMTTVNCNVGYLPVSCLVFSSTLKTEAICSSET